MAANLNNKGNKSGYNAADKRQAKGYLNIYAPGATGRRKLGVIFLFEDDPSQKAVADYLAKDPANADKLLSVCEFEYNPNTPESDKMFVLPE